MYNAKGQIDVPCQTANRVAFNNGKSHFLDKRTIPAYIKSIQNILS